MKKISFAVDKFSLEDIDNSQLSKLTIYVCHDGENKNSSLISLDSIKAASPTLLRKPILYKYSKILNDTLEHEEDEIVGGYIPEVGANIRYEKIDERTYLVADAILWNYYATDLVNLFIRDSEKSVSMEIAINEEKELEDDKVEYASFSFLGVTVLGNMFEPGMYNTTAKLANFSKEKFEDLVKETDSFITSFSKNSSKSRLKSKKKEFIESPKQQQEIPIVEDINTKKDKEDDVMFKKAEFALSVGMTANEIRDMVSTACNTIKYASGDYEYSKYWVRDFDDKYVYAVDEEKGGVVAIPYTLDNKECKMNFEDIKAARMRYIIDEDPQEDDSDDLMEMAKKMAADEVAKKDEDVSKFKEDIEKMSTEKQTLETEKATMSTEIETYKSKISDLEKDKEELAKFKADIEEQDRLAKVEFAIEEVSQDLTSEQVTEWREKSKTFENTDDFANAIRAFAYSVTKGLDKQEKKTYSRIHIPQTPVEEKKTGLWD